MQRIAGPGIGLPPPQNLYPTELYNASIDVGTNRVMLTPGTGIQLPAGDFALQAGAFSFFQILDPVMNIWRGFAPLRGQQFFAFDDGFTRRLINLTGCPVAAVVAGGGSSFTQATATITANTGGSTWTPIVGGSLDVKSIVNPGASFTIPPLVLIPDPPTYAANGLGGVPATFYATLANGTVSAVTAGDVGGGYVATTITALLLPSPYDPNAGVATPGSVNFTLVNAGKITAALCTNNGASLSSVTALTLTAAGGAGSGATITPVICQSIKATTIVAGGGGWGTATAPAKVTSVGGQPVSVSAINNPSIELTGYRPRDANITGTCNAGGTITALTVIDSGLFVGSPTFAVAPAGTLPATLASITFTMGGVNDTVEIQPL